MRLLEDSVERCRLRINRGRASRSSAR
jgi:hypothetical protein